MRLQPDSQQPDIFISYSSADRPFVSKLNTRLNDLGIRTWFDQTRIQAGSAWKQRIEQGLEVCSGLIVILTPNSVQSKWVKFEWETAQAQGKPVFPVLRENCVNPFPHMHYEDFQDDREFETRLFRLVQSICMKPVIADCESLLANLESKTGIEFTLSRLAQETDNAQQWLAGIQEPCQNGVAWRMDEPQDTLVTDRLVSLALNTKYPNPQIALDAATTIGHCGYTDAVDGLREALDKPEHTAQGLDALYQVWEAAGRIPFSLLRQRRWRVTRHVAWRQVSGYPSMIAATGLTFVGIAFVMFVTLFSLFPDSADRFLLDRVGNALSNAVTYSLVITIGVILAYQVLPRLRLLGVMRFVAAILAGWLFVSVNFYLLYSFYFDRVPESWSDVIWLSLLFVGGYVATGLIAPESPVRTAWRFVWALLGVSLAFVIPCDWPLFRLRLMPIYSDQCLPESIGLGIVIVFLSFLPEMWRHVWRR